MGEDRAEPVKEVAKKTDDVAVTQNDGDRPAQAVVREGLRNVAAGANRCP